MWSAMKLLIPTFSRDILIYKRHVYQSAVAHAAP